MLSNNLKEIVQHKRLQAKKIFGRLLEFKQQVLNKLLKLKDLIKQRVFRLLSKDKAPSQDSEG